jgi:hypothetical protein
MQFRLMAAVTLAAFAFVTAPQAEDSPAYPPLNGGKSVTKPASQYVREA